jgi:ribosomal protein S18 acetylase RimI-like enzyme
MGIGSLAKLGISKGMSLGRELFGFLLRSDLNVAKIAEWAGITMDTLKDAPPEALSAILDRAARSGAIDPREANNINIQLAKEAQEAMPAMPSIKKETRGSPENPYEVLTYLDETSGEPLGEMYLRKLRDGSNEVASVTVNPETRRQGVATALYNAAGISAPSDNITLDAFNFWKNRDPNSLPDSLYNYYDDLIGLEIPDMGLITDVRNNFASVKKGGISGPLYKNQLQDMGLIPKEPK